MSHRNIIIQRIRRIIGVKPLNMQRKSIPTTKASFTFAQGMQNPEDLKKKEEEKDLYKATEEKKEEEKVATKVEDTS